MKIFIPSMQRAGQQITLGVLRAAGVPASDIYIVVPTKEIKTYKDEDAVVLGTLAKGIADTRQFCLDYAHDCEYPYIIMFDDDLTFQKRRTDDPTKFVPCTPKDVKAMLGLFAKLATKYASVGGLAREGGHRKTEPLSECDRPQRAHAFDVERVRALGCRYNSGLNQDDFDMTLQLLRKGAKNVIVNSYVNSQVMSNANGGASSYLTIERHNASVMRLAKIHHPFVRVVDKPPQVSGAWGGHPRKDVHISWKRAYASANR